MWVDELEEDSHDGAPVVAGAGSLSVPERWEERAKQDLSAGAAALFCSPGCSQGASRQIGQVPHWAKSQKEEV